MSHTKLRARLLTILAALIPLSLLAADGDTFTYTYEGQTLSYTVISEADKTVQTKEGYKEGNEYFAGNKVSGDLKLPQTVYNGDVAYTLTVLGSYAFSNCEGLTSVTIPESVTSIGAEVFSSCGSLTSITLPESLTSIGYQAFYYCYNLTNITLPESVTSVGLYVFKHCYNLTHPVYNAKIFAYYPPLFAGSSYAIPQGIAEIAGGAFMGCKDLTNITLPESVTSIGDDAFSGCYNLTNITLPESLTSIGAKAFLECSNLTSITLPESLTKIGTWAFSGCSNLTSITLPESLTSIGYSVFYGCGLTQPVYNTKIFAFYPSNSTATSYVIPQGIEIVAGGAFNRCSNLTSIILPESVISIGDWAFHNCSNLTNITLPESLTSMGAWTFLGCSSLTSITLPESLTRIEMCAFQGCSSLTSITISESVTRIEMCAFQGCSSLTYLSVPASVTAIGDWCFNGCTNLLSQSITPTYILNNAHADNLKGDITIHAILSDAEQDNQQNLMGLTPSTDYTIDCGLAINGIFCPIATDYTVRTPEVTLTTLPGEAQDATTVLLSAETNIGELEENVGFEWRRNDEDSTIPTQTIPGSISNGKLQATLSGLSPDVTYNYRPYLKCANGNVYYGDWATVSTRDAEGAIEEVTTADADAKAVDYCNLRGQRSTHPFPGLNIVRFSDGTTRKLLLK